MSTTRSSTTRKPRDRHANGGQGMNWIRQSTRLAIYLRDGCACAYCGRGIERGISLTLDHLHPHSLGGGNRVTNLVTACKPCNSSRGDRPITAFVAPAKRRHVLALAFQPLAPHRAEARNLIARRGSAFRALAHL